MKKPNIILLLLMVLACLAACHKDKEMDVKEAVVSNEEMTVTETQAHFSWQVDFAGQFQTGVEVSQNENLADLRRVEASKEEDKFVAVVDSLTEGTTYYYRFVVWNKFGSSEQSVGNFKTMETPPTPGQDTTYYDITVSVNLPEGGTATGGGRFAEGDTCRVIATANEGYVFVNWTENDNPIDTNSVYSFVVSSDRELVANFREEDAVLYTVITKAEPVEGGMVTGGGTYEEGREIELKATANTGYTFIQWNDGSTDNPRTVTVTADVTYTAYFNHDEYEIKVECQPENGGTATGGGRFHYGDTIALSATPNANFNFEGWSDGCTDNPREVVVTGNATYKAVFSEAGAVYYNVATHVYPGDYAGTVTGGGPHPEGSQIQLSANANTEAGYLFEKWDDGNTDNPRTITVNSDMEFTAFFKKKTYTVTVQAGTGGAAHIGDMSGTIEATFEHGESCTVHAIPETGYSFVNWTENGTEASTDDNYSFIVTSNHNLVANFQQQQQQQYWIDTSAEPTGSGTVGGGNRYYNHGEQCILTAMSNNYEQYGFDYWTKDGSTYPGGASITFMVTEAATYTAHFCLKQYTVSVSASPSNGGIVSGGGTYAYGQSCTVDASASNGYIFLNWTKDGYHVSSNASYTFNVTGYCSLTAHFITQSQAPLGAINGVFSINETEQAWFSQGNLQYQASSNTWKFAENQYDYLGQANSNISSTSSGWIDLFGWGTSGWNCGNTYYRPWNSENDNGNLYGPPGNNGLTGSYANSDWGYYNSISNGGNISNMWRTLSSSEWGYVLWGRYTPSGIRYAKAQVNNVNGIILLPDNWSNSYYTLNNTNQDGASFSSNVINSSTWTNSLQSYGAVFLPAAGCRNGTSVFYEDNIGYYWSTSPVWGSNASSLSLYLNETTINSSYHSNPRFIGSSVRLVYPIQ
jgi:hypothetical protein